ncbi:hypothetical protein DFH07DRAFT_850752 [Mycena maculata]|uniref:Uncharacterized protein n=1 Tax=Mycena maculata TaxID=230809 RepID=A0AAD7HV18_9AGAR|nr:hypothetical protein DFH07DRAFT_850752 [Mycena maculata]
MTSRVESTPEALQGSVAAIFDQAQSSLMSHCKNYVVLYKAHVRASAKNGSSKRSKAQPAFISVLLDMISRVAGVKKGPPRKVLPREPRNASILYLASPEDKANRQARGADKLHLVGECGRHVYSCLRCLNGSSRASWRRTRSHGIRRYISSHK